MRIPPLTLLSVSNATRFSSNADKNLDTCENNCTLCLKSPDGDRFVSSIDKAEEVGPFKFPEEILNFECVKKPEKFVRQFANTTFISNAIEQNPRIPEIMYEYGLDPKSIEPGNVLRIIDTHLIPTMKCTLATLAKENESTPDKDRLTITENIVMATLLHDIGKILIPSSILNSTAELTKEERDIVNLHSRLGYEILKTAQDEYKPIFDELALSLVCNHHNHNLDSADVTKYTKALMVADVYSALIEKRPYRKESYSPSDAMAIMTDESTERGGKKAYLPAKEVSTLKSILSGAHILRS